jgi:hypothetical protein
MHPTPDQQNMYIIGITVSNGRLTDEQREYLQLFYDNTTDNSFSYQFDRLKTENIIFHSERYQRINLHRCSKYASFYCIQHKHGKCIFISTYFILSYVNKFISINILIKNLLVCYAKLLFFFVKQVNSVFTTFAAATHLYWSTNSTFSILDNFHVINPLVDNTKPICIPIKMLHHRLLLITSSKKTTLGCKKFIIVQEFKD